MRSLAVSAIIQICLCGFLCFWVVWEHVLSWIAGENGLAVAVQQTAGTVAGRVDGVNHSKSRLVLLR